MTSTNALILSTGAVIIALLAWPQVQEYQAKRRAAEIAARLESIDRAKTEELRRLICPGLYARDEINPDGVCKDWKPK